MSAYYCLEPQVAGDFGPDTILDTSTHPPGVVRFQWEWRAWLGDELLATFPCFVVSVRLGDALAETALSGFTLQRIEAIVGDEFVELGIQMEPPPLYWLRVSNAAGEADFGIGEKHSLVVSARALDVLRAFPLQHCEVAPWVRVNAAT